MTRKIKGLAYYDKFRLTEICLCDIIISQGRLTMFQQNPFILSLTKSFSVCQR